MTTECDRRFKPKSTSMSGNKTKEGIMNKPTILATLLSLCRSGSGRICTILFSCLRLLFCCLWLFGGLLLPGSLVHAEAQAGEMLVCEQRGGTNGLGSLVLVNPTPGRRTGRGHVGNPAQG